MCPAADSWLDGVRVNKGVWHRRSITVKVALFCSCFLLAGQPFCDLGSFLSVKHENAALFQTGSDLLTRPCICVVDIL